MLDNVRSAQNVGSVFRTCEGAGVEKIYLGGYTPTPKDRFGRVRNDVAKTALGAETILPWQLLEKEQEVLTCLRKYKLSQYKIIAIEQTNDSIPFCSANIPQKAVYVFGNEIEGVSKNILNMVDEVIEIPMLGQKESLNVSVTVGIILFRC